MRRTVGVISFLFMASLLPCLPSQAQSAADSRAESSPNNNDAAKPLDSGFSERNPRYALRLGDSFDVEFAFSPEFNQTLAVEPDGYVALRGAGTYHVAGETIPQLTETIRHAYSGILHDPEISVLLKNFEMPYFIAAGQVSKPGKYEIRSDTSLVEAINIAGGLTDSSKHSEVVLFRRVTGDRVEAHLYDVKKMLASRDLSEDPLLQPGDVVYVPQNAISKIRRYLPTTSMGLYGAPVIP